MRALSLCFLLSVAVVAACTKQDEKAVKDEPKKTTPVTSADLGELNDFLPPAGGATGLRVKLDGGGEAGLPAEVAAGGSSGGGGAGAGGGGGAEPGGAIDDKLKVTEAGSDPKSARKYSFATGKTEKRLITIAQESQRAGARGGGLGLSMAMDFTPKKSEPKGTLFELKLIKVELPNTQGIPPAQAQQIAQALGGLSGLAGSLEISPRGEVSEVSFASDQKMQNPLAEGVVQGISQVTELLTPPFPEQPIGVGAKWERSVEKTENGVKQSSKAVYVLKEANAEGGVVETDIEIKVPKKAVQGKGIPPGTTVSADGKGHYTYQFRWTSLATKVTGELRLKQHIEAMDEQGKKQVVDDIQVAKQTIDTPK